MVSFSSFRLSDFPNFLHIELALLLLYNKIKGRSQNTAPQGRAPSAGCRTGGAQVGRVP